MDMDMDQIEDNEQYVDQNQEVQHEGGDKEQSAQQIPFMNQADGDNTVTQRIECQIKKDDDEAAKRAIQDWQRLDQNKDFVSRHSYQSW